ncbi:SurA N-terminal domain-containing protein [Kocuria sp. M1R5S2]|uniref:SurA N-terminal domain-containing protein n=1 Tax=Kocuria rhizosphaerae TaxID=3376285 RepID=UPI0037B9542A
MRRKLLTSVALVGSLIGLSACGTTGAGDSEPTTAGTAGAGAQQDGGSPRAGEASSDAEGGQQAMPEPDLEGIPDVVATVNGEGISGDDFTGVYESRFQQVAMQAQMSGEEIDQDQLKKQTADLMVGSELLVQDARDKGHEATDEDVDKLLKEAAEAQQLGSVDKLLATYEERGFSEEQVRSDARKQVLMTASIEEIDVPKPTEEELKALYDQAAAQPQSGQGGEAGAPAETPSYEELKPQLEQQVAAQKQDDAIMKRMEELKEDADVDVRV